MSRRAKVVAILVVLALVVVGIPLTLYLVAVAVTGEAPAWRDQAKVCEQPDDVTYRDGRYAVFLRTPTARLSLSEPPASAMISRTPDGTYGVVVELNPTSDTGPLICTWTGDDVTITEPNGITHTVPASVFTGGR